MAIAAPRPIGRMVDETPCHRILVTIVDLLQKSVVAVNVEVVAARVEYDPLTLITFGPCIQGTRPESAITTPEVAQSVLSMIAHMLLESV